MIYVLCLQNYKIEGEWHTFLTKININDAKCTSFYVKTDVGAPIDA